MNTLLALAVYTISATKTLAADFVLGTSSVRAERHIDLTNRYPDPWVSNVFKDNILLALAYMDGDVKSKGDINWDEVSKPQSYSLSLEPGETFAFHEVVLPEYRGNVTKTTNAHFNGEDGFKSDGWLIGDGVCHLASIMYWAALDAGLSTVAKTNHDFMNIPDVPKEYGVSILYHPDGARSSALQNLYITNTLPTTVEFAFAYDGKILSLEVND